MNAKQYLQQAFQLNKMIDADRFELIRLRELAESIPSTLQVGEHIQASGQADHVGNLMAKIVDLEMKIQAEINQYIDMKREIRERICQINDHKLKLILQKRYINFQTWEEIAYEFRKEVRWIFELHKRALKIFAEIKDVSEHCNAV